MPGPHHRIFFSSFHVPLLSEHLYVSVPSFAVLLISPCMGKASCFVPMYVGSAVWQTLGYSAVIYIAALANVNPELYEAAKIDGASKFQCVINIDVPSLIPTMILLIMQIGQIMNIGYEKVYLMQNALNLSKSEIISTYVYKLGLQQARYDFSTAVNLFNTVINFAVLMVVNRAAKKISGTSLW